MSNRDVINELAAKLLKAYQDKQPIEFIRHKYSIDEKTAYAVQDELIRRKQEAEGTEMAGYKISMTSKETQVIANTDEPAYGTLLSDNIVKSGETIDMSSLFSPLIEPELLFFVEEDISPGASEEEILSKTKLAAGIEIPDARYKNWFPNFSLADLLSDNTATGLVAVGEPVVVPSFETLADIGLELFHEDEKISEGSSSAVLGNPVTALVWLSEKLASHGKELKKGMVISSGTFISPLPAKKGTYRAAYTHAGSVTIELT